MESDGARAAHCAHALASAIGSDPSRAIFFVLCLLCQSERLESLVNCGRCKILGFLPVGNCRLITSTCMPESPRPEEAQGSPPPPTPQDSIRTSRPAGRKARNYLHFSSFTLAAPPVPVGRKVAAIQSHVAFGRRGISPLNASRHNYAHESRQPS